MQNAKTIKIPLWNGIDTADVIGQRKFESVAEEIALAGTIVDNFDDSSINSTRWSANTSGGGTVSETNQLDLNGSSAADASSVNSLRDILALLDRVHLAPFNAGSAGNAELRIDLGLIMWRD